MKWEKLKGNWLRDWMVVEMDRTFYLFDWNIYRVVYIDFGIEKLCQFCLCSGLPILLL